MKQFEDKVAVVTGATAGIGREIAVAFARHGAGVAVAGRNRERGEETVSKIEEEGGKAFFVEVDISRADSVSNLFRTAAEIFGGVDFAINNAGIEQQTLMITETPDEMMADTVDTNLKGTWLCLKYALPEIRKRRGAIVNISSFWGVVGMVGGSAYTATKGGIIALTRAVAAEEGVAKTGVRVNCVSPGAIQTAMLDRVVKDAHLDIAEWVKEKTMLGRIGTPSEVADAVIYLASSASSYISGENLMLDGGYTAMKI